MNAYLQEIGLETSFRDAAEISPRWEIIAKGLLDETTQRAKLFKKNLLVKQQYDKKSEKMKRLEK